MRELIIGEGIYDGEVIAERCDVGVWSDNLCRYRDTWIAPFNDVYNEQTKPLHFCYDIKVALQRWWISPNTSFTPEYKINRAEFLKIALKSSWVTDEQLKKYENSTCFKDVTEPWQRWIACYAKANGIINGYENGTLFKPTEIVKNDIMVKIILESFWIKAYQEN